MKLLAMRMTSDSNAATLHMTMAAVLDMATKDNCWLFFGLATECRKNDFNGDACLLSIVCTFHESIKKYLEGRISE